MCVAEELIGNIGLCRCLDSGLPVRTDALGRRPGLLRQSHSCSTPTNYIKCLFGLSRDRLAPRVFGLALLAFYPACCDCNDEIPCDVASINPSPRDHHATHWTAPDGGVHAQATWVRISTAASVDNVASGTLRMVAPPCLRPMGIA